MALSKFFVRFGIAIVAILGGPACLIFSVIVAMLLPPIIFLLLQIGKVISAYKTNPKRFVQFFIRYFGAMCIKWALVVLVALYLEWPTEIAGAVGFALGALITVIALLSARYGHYFRNFFAPLT